MTTFSDIWRATLVAFALASLVAAESAFGEEQRQKAGKSTTFEKPAGQKATSDRIELVLACLHNCGRWVDGAICVRVCNIR
jgi:hypothetical protein